MNITNNMTAPSFQAKLKKNENVVNWLKMMNDAQIQETRDVLRTLDEKNKDVVFEFRTRRAGHYDTIPEYGFLNPKTGVFKKFQGGGRPDANKFINGLRSLCNSCDPENVKFFGASEKHMKEVMDLLA